MEHLDGSQKSPLPWTLICVASETLTRTHFFAIEVRAN
jgi:hypothetical protein